MNSTYERGLTILRWRSDGDKNVKKRNKFNRVFLHDACHVRHFVVPKQLNLRRVFDMFMSPCKRKQNYWPKTPNIIVGRHVQRTFEHPVACYCMLRQQWFILN